MIVLAKPSRYAVHISPRFTGSMTCNVTWPNGTATVYLLTWDSIGDPVPPDIMRELHEQEQHLLTCWRELHPE